MKNIEYIMLLHKILQYDPINFSQHSSLIFLYKIELFCKNYLIVIHKYEKFIFDPVLGSMPFAFTLVNLHSSYIILIR